MKRILKLAVSWLTVPVAVIGGVCFLVAFAKNWGDAYREGESSYYHQLQSAWNEANHTNLSYQSFVTLYDRHMLPGQNNNVMILK